MKRREFLGFLALLPFATKLPSFYSGESEKALASAAGGQFVFDGVNGLTFPAQQSNAATITRFRSRNFIEQLLEVFK